MVKERKLTEKEIRRQKVFEELCAEYKANGYEQNDLTSDPVKANTLGPLYGLLLSIPFIVIFFVRFGLIQQIGDHYFRNYLIFMVLMFVFIVVHELLHGLTWSLFTPNHFKDVEFGIMWQSLNPYCACKKALKRNQYILGLLMPCIVLGIIPMIVSLFTGNLWWLAMGVLMTISAGGDLLILTLILGHKPKRKEYFLDHPTQIGLLVLEKE